MTIKKIQKRDGRIEAFAIRRIEDAVYNAAYEVLADKKKAKNIARNLVRIVPRRIDRVFKSRMPTVEGVQDIVEQTLMERGYNRIAKSYILYRERHKEVRLAKSLLGVKDDLKLPLNTMQVLKARYLLKDERQRVFETPSELFRRVASCVAGAEKGFRSSYSRAHAEEKFFGMMRDLEFLPNSPTLMNAGTPLGQLSACFVLPIGDSIDEIFASLGDMAKIHQTGGGTGFDFSRLRPKGDLVSTTNGLASGPVSFMSIFDKATDIIVQGGKRRGANMGILRCDHPDIFDFIEAKSSDGIFSNFNFSIGVTDKFMKALASDGRFDLINPRNGRAAGSVKARSLFDLMVNAAWRTGDPGVIFLDEINRRHPLKGLGTIAATNPCGELPLLPYESCNLGSVNLSRMVKDGEVDWQGLKDAVAWSVRFLDNVIEMNRFPLKEIGRMTRGSRKIGLGVMGFADMLIRLGIPYTSKKALETGGAVMRFIRQQSLAASARLAAERGVFPNYGRSVYKKKNMKIRNATLNTIAPTGTISIIAGCSSGIEPLFAVSYVRNVLSGSRLFEMNPLFEEEARRRGLLDKGLMSDLAVAGSLQSIGKIPADMKRLFITAFDVPWSQHLGMQAAFQRHTDNSVSKTINLRTDASVDDVRKIFLSAHRLGLKGITVYRYGTKRGQALSFAEEPSKGDTEPPVIAAAPEYSGGCVSGTCIF